MEGLEIKEVLFSKVDLGDRFDAEFFEKEDLKIENILNKSYSRELRNFGSFVASAFYPAATHLYKVGNTPFIRCVDCINFPVITHEQDVLFENIPFEFINEYTGINILNKGDIVITKVGTPSYPSIIYEHDKVALSRTVMGIKNIHGINNYYLLVFLRSKFGFSQLQRHRELTIQYQLTLERIKRTLIFEPSSFFQREIEDIIHNFIQKLNGSKLIYSQAENLLLETLSLKDFKPSREKVNIKSFKDSFLSSGRLDAEYYKVKYEEIIEKIKLNKYARLTEIANIKKSIEPGSNAYSDEGIPFVRVADYNKFGIKEPVICLSNSFIKENYIKLDDLKPKTGTILFSKDGSVGQAHVLKEDKNLITSGAILHLKVKDKQKVLPEYLALVLNSQPVQMQAERDAGGSIILHWRVSEIENVLVPIIDYKIQQQISEMIEESFRLKNQSEQLLEIAKTAVEKAIEEEEEVAMEYIDKGLVQIKI